MIKDFSLNLRELQLVYNKSNDAKIGFSVLYKSLQNYGKFPMSKEAVSEESIEFIAKQLKIDKKTYLNYDFNSRNAFFHKKQIREELCFREYSKNDMESIKEWLIQIVLPVNDDIEYLKQQLYKRFYEIKIESTTEETLERIVSSAINTYENNMFENIFNKLPVETIRKFNLFIAIESENDNTEQTIWFNDFSINPDGANIESVFNESNKLKTIENMIIPEDIFKDIPPKYLKKYYKRSKSENVSEFKRHPDVIRNVLLSVFFHYKSMEIKDNLVDLLIKILNNLDTSANRKIKKELAESTNYTRNKNKLLLKIAKAVVESPEAKTCDIIYPIADEQKLKDLINELENKSDDVLNKKNYNNMRSSYQKHYRRILPDIINALNFNSNNDKYKPIIKAIELIKKYLDSKSRYYSKDEIVPIEGVVRPMWKGMIEETTGKNNALRIKRANYELCALQALKDKIRCREVWISGADKYRNPDEDLPKDFDIKKEEYYSAINQPLDVNDFIEKIKSSMKDSLSKLNKTIPKNEKVKILDIGNGRIKISPSPKQPEAKNLLKLKREISNRWPDLNLLDVFKEADLRIDFTKHLKTSATQERLTREIIRKRLLVSLYGMGTNMGLKAVSSKGLDENYMDLEYIKRKFINKDNLRAAIAEVVNATLKIRSQNIWGSATTTCASDSKKFGAWDQNLRAEWHNRYHGRGIMIYWHVEKKSLCVYSQVKSCSSSEVASAIEGVLRHCTDMSIEKNYVDTHGQSEVAFAFSCLLGFKLMPRIKNINKQKLYKPEISDEDYSNIELVMKKKPINWELIRQQYDQMVKYATALRLGTADAESILKKFTKNNLQHPTYQALSELGRAIKTIFICRYVMSEEMRIEINQGLNVIENWNSANNFIFCARGREFSTNNIEDQEISALALHLIQNCMVYVNTLLIQDILSEEEWFNSMEKEDFRAITPLIYSHVNPYGNFNLDMDKRIHLGVQKNAC
ncbi:Tn3 family transposase [Clostridium sp.]|jgi:TnpA family transposase|uniref:Tn3 family transposase n=1 Tax=Clostridium sp. TaxID=1506 RepID=UPI003EE8EA4C